MLVFGHGSACVVVVNGSEEVSRHPRVMPPSIRLWCFNALHNPGSLQILINSFLNEEFPNMNKTGSALTK